MGEESGRYRAGTGTSLLCVLLFFLACVAGHYSNSIIMSGCVARACHHGRPSAAAWLQVFSASQTCLRRRRYGEAERRARPDPESFPRIAHVSTLLALNLPADVSLYDPSGSYFGSPLRRHEPSGCASVS